jgi:hypothetical protein
MNLEENQETHFLVSWLELRTIRAPTVSEGVQSLLAGDDSFFGLNIRHWICEAGEEAAAWR